MLTSATTWMAVGALGRVVIGDLGVLGSHIRSAVALGAGIGAVEGRVAGGTAAGAAVIRREGMAEADRGPVIGVVALRALPGEMSRWSLAGMAGGAVGGVLGGVVEGCAGPGAGGMAL